MELRTYLRLKKLAEAARIQLQMDASYPVEGGSPSTVIISIRELEELLELAEAVVDKP